MNIILTKSKRKNKKWQAVLFNKNGKRKKTIHFGDNRYLDYTQHKNKSRMERYVARHRTREQKFWNRNNVMTPAFMSRFITWSKPSLDDAIRYTNNRFNINIKLK